MLEMRLSMAQADAAKRALGLYVRIGCGIFDEMEPQAAAGDLFGVRCGELPDNGWEDPQTAEVFYGAMLRIGNNASLLRLVMGYPKEPGAKGHGIEHPHVARSFKIAWEIEQAIAMALNEGRRRAGMQGVEEMAPWSRAIDGPVPKVRVAEAASDKDRVCELALTSEQANALADAAEFAISLGRGGMKPLRQLIDSGALPMYAPQPSSKRVTVKDLPNGADRDHLLALTEDLISGIESVIGEQPEPMRQALRRIRECAMELASREEPGLREPTGPEQGFAG